LINTFVLATSWGKVSLQDVIEHLSSYHSAGLVRASLSSYWVVFVLSIAVLATGLWQSWRVSHLSLPLLFWAFKTSVELTGHFSLGFPHVVFYASSFLEAVIALVGVIGLVALAVTRLDVRGASRSDLALLLCGFLAASTVVLDGVFLLMFVVPFPK